MRSLAGRVGVLLLLASPHRAAAQDLALWLVPTDGPPRPGDVVTLEVAASLGGAPLSSDEVPRIDVVDSEPLGAPVLAAPGRWHSRWRVPAQAEAGGQLVARVSLGGLAQELTVPIVAAERSTLTVPESLDAEAGRPGELRLPVFSSDPPAAADLQVMVAEGQVLGVEPGAAELAVRWQPVDDPLPRVVPWVVRDARQPRRPPAWGVVRLTGHPRIPIATDPGSRVRVEVGGRSYGPFLADAQGVAVASIEVRPGETAAEVVAADELGNERRTRIALGGATPPRMLLLAEGSLVPGQPLPELHVVAVRGDGRPWTGRAPDCRTAVGAPLVLAATAPGLWRAALPPGVEALFDLRVECTLEDQARATLQVPVEPGVPAAVRLRVWPTEVDADLPVAQVQAWLEGPLGDRLAALGIVLHAERGSLTSEPGSGATVVATYDGSAAVEAGGDRIEARWSPPAGAGGAWRLAVGLDAGIQAAPGVAGSLPVVAQALDRLGRPLAGVELLLGAAGTERAALTDAQGRARVDLPVPEGPGPWVVRVRSGAVEHRRLLFAADAGDPSQLPAAQLSAGVDLRVRTGDVRRIVVSAQPERLAAGGGESARVVVTLQDQSGHAVTDQVPRVEASEGRVGRVRLNDDGSFEAEYTPPARLAYGEVELAVTGPEERWSATTTVEITPRRLRRAVGPSGGFMFGSRAVRSAFGGVELDFALPLLPAALLGRASVSAFGERSVVQDDTTGEQVEVETTWLPLGLGLVGRQERGRLAFFGGLEVQVVPFRQVSVYGDRVATRSPGLVAPGLEPLVGLGYRVWGTELQAQLSYLWLTMPASDVGYSGLVGGFQPALGWKVLF